jgi:hypothetical protein
LKGKQRTLAFPLILDQGSIGTSAGGVGGRQPIGDDFVSKAHGFAPLDLISSSQVPDSFDSCARYLPQITATCGRLAVMVEQALARGMCLQHLLIGSLGIRR